MERKACIGSIVVILLCLVLLACIYIYRDKIPKISKAEIYNTAVTKNFDGNLNKMERYLLWGKSAFNVNMDEQPSSKGFRIPTAQPDETVLNAIAYNNNTSDNDGDIEEITFEHCTDSKYLNLPNNAQVRNCSGLSNSEVLKLCTQPIKLNFNAQQGEPLVLIYHTHTTETYEPYQKDYYDKDFTAKTTDPKYNMTAVGDAICEELENAGVCYIHDTTVHDYPSYTGAYDDSRATVEQILKEYPSIQIVLDVHRDAIEREDGTRVSAIADIDGKTAAQLMIISCCDDGTDRIPNWKENLAFASVLQQRLYDDYPELVRGIFLTDRFYNQDLSTGSLLVEVGSHGNSLDQSVYSGHLLGKSLAKIINENKQ